MSLRYFDVVSLLETLPHDTSAGAGKWCRPLGFSNLLFWRWVTGPLRLRTFGVHLSFEDWRKRSYSWLSAVPAYLMSSVVNQIGAVRQLCGINSQNTLFLFRCLSLHQIRKEECIDGSVKERCPWCILINIFWKICIIGTVSDDYRFTDTCLDHLKGIAILCLMRASITDGLQFSRTISTRVVAGGREFDDWNRS